MLQGPLSGVEMDKWFKMKRFPFENIYIAYQTPQKFIPLALFLSSPQAVLIGELPTPNPHNPNGTDQNKTDQNNNNNEDDDDDPINKAIKKMKKE